MSDRPTPLVLLHGFPFTSEMWHDVLALLEESGVPTLTVDAPGLGTTPIPPGEPSVELAAENVRRELDARGADRAVLAGLSMGGYIALAFAASHPSRVAGLALLDTKASADTDEGRANRLRMAANAEGPLGSGAAAGMLESLLGTTTLANRPDVVAQHRAWLAAAPPAGIAWGQRAMAARPSRFEVLEDLTVPGLVIRGAEDLISTQTDAEAMVRALAAGDGDAELVVIPAAGHMTATEDPVATARALESFWRRCVAGLDRH